ncbi:leucine-rich repeat protein [Hepatocystis sp. ex Piliocolobus tephrosceles]|nr:leucine-rich repeat protein [Hepatocystis sp. ex Piliocolobus tephrosceles]
MYQNVLIQKIKIEKGAIFSSSPLISEDDLADFVSTINTKNTVTEKYKDVLKLTIINKIILASLNINDWGLSIFIPCILKCQNLFSLDLSNNNLTNDSAKRLSMCFKHLPYLRRLNLSNNNIRSDGAINVINEFLSFNLDETIEKKNKDNDYVFSNKQLKYYKYNNLNYINKNIYELDLSDNKLDDSFILSLSKLLAKNNLQYNKCSEPYNNCNNNNKFEKYYSTNINIYKKSNKISVNNNLYKKQTKPKYRFVFKNIELTDASVLYLFKNCTYVEVLDISQNNINPSTCFPIHMKTLFNTQLHLKELHLSDIYKNSNNKIRTDFIKGDDDFLELIKHLPKLTKLKIISYTNNYITDVSFNFFCIYLKNNKNVIKEINFANNYITNINVLTYSLQNNKTLNIINLSQNKITDEYMKLFCYSILSTNLNIYEISLSGNPISNLTCNYLADALMAQCNLIKQNIKLKSRNNNKKKKKNNINNNNNNNIVLSSTLCNNDLQPFLKKKKKKLSFVLHIFNSLTNNIHMDTDTVQNATVDTISTSTSTPTLNTSTLSDTNNIHTSNIHTNNIHTSNIHTSNIHTNNIHTNNTHTNNIHTNNIHTSNIHTNNIHTNDTHTNNTHTNNTHTNDTHTNNIHTNNIHTNNTHTNDTHTNNTHTKDTHTNPNFNYIQNHEQTKKIFNSRKKNISLIHKIKKLKKLIINRHNDEVNLFSTIGNIHLNKATDISKNRFLQKQKRILIYNKNDFYYYTYRNFSINCFKGLKFINISNCNIDNEGLHYFIKSLIKPYCPLEFLDISSSQEMFCDVIHHAFNKLIHTKKNKFFKNISTYFKNLPLSIRGLPPKQIRLDDSDDNADAENKELAWWNNEEE